MPFDGLFTTDSEQIAQLITVEDFKGEDKPFLIVSYGLGRDSSAMLVRLASLGIRPDLIVFCDLGAEKAASYAYLQVMNEFLKSVGFPEITIIQLKRTRDTDFEAHLFRLGIFASFNYGKSHACSATWKLDAQDDFLKTYQPVVEAKRQGRRIVRAVGFEAGEEYRVKDGKKKGKKADAGDIETCSDRNSSAFAVSKKSEYLTWYPLIQWNMDFDAVLDTIWLAGLPIPPKSSCYFCPAMTLEETIDLAKNEPQLFFKGLVLERICQRNPIVQHDRRVQGLRFGQKWSDYDCAAPYRDRIDEVIDLFGLDRAFEDGDPNPRAETWRPKTARVELFRECFATAENLRRFMNNELDMTVYAEKIQEINLMPTGAQMALPL